MIELLKRTLATSKSSYHVHDEKHIRIAARRIGKSRGNVGFGNARAIQALVDLASERQTARVVAERRAGGAPDIFEFQRADLLGEPPKLLDADTSVPLRVSRRVELHDYYCHTTNPRSLDHSTLVPHHQTTNAPPSSALPLSPPPPPDVAGHGGPRGGQEFR